MGFFQGLIATSVNKDIGPSAVYMTNFKLQKNLVTPRMRVALKRGCKRNSVSRQFEIVHGMHK
ncbi:hypothetical protein RRG08_062584, partial [Elysia crispata]